MRSDGVRIIKAATVFSTQSTGYDNTHRYMHGYEIDLTRKTAALIRQSRRGADEDNPESRLRQKGLATVALEIRGDHDPLMVIPYDEGAGVSGQKKIYERPKLLELWKALLDSTIGSIIVAREDRLFRDRWLTQPTQFAAECAQRGVILIVAGRRAYDFRIQDDFKAFLRKMEEAYGYIDTHVKYMMEMKLQKLQRGEWVGGNLIAPYILDRLAIQEAKEHRKIMKEFGASDEEELLITKAYRPVIYEPWREIAVELFEKFKLFDYSRSRMGRYIEERQYIFPFPSAEDMQQYIFKTRMSSVSGLGYTFTVNSRLSTWLSNLMHQGYIGVGKDTQGSHVYIEGAFEAAIPRDLFEPAYEAITGFTLDGQPSTMRPNHRRFVRSKPIEDQTALLTQQFRAPDNTWGVRTEDGPPLYYAAYLRRTTQTTETYSYMESNRLWSLPCTTFDRIIVERLSALAAHDKDLAARVENYYKNLHANTVSEKKAILREITALQAKIARYDKLLTTPARPLTESQEGRYLDEQAQAERDLAMAQSALERYDRMQPAQFIPKFYRILGQAPGEFWSLDIDRQRHMLSLLIEEIQVTSISPHLYKLLLKWKDPVANRWDCAILFKRQAIRSKLLNVSQWTPAEDDILRQLWPDTNGFVISQQLPTKTSHAMKVRALQLGVHRSENFQKRRSPLHRALCYSDWTGACAALETDPETEEGMKILEMLSYYAHTTGKETPLSCWWVLPVVDMNGPDEDWTRPLSRPPCPELLPTCKVLTAIPGSQPLISWPRRLWCRSMASFQTSLGANLSSWWASSSS
ncbi:hypothetical protein KSC_044130 [Ktedonobacter sp. SOSP1-52]|nr:hypothetical protein KSC_044130 [Ktedonobacter sp. SOSP1-52]